MVAEVTEKTFLFFFCMFSHVLERIRVHCGKVSQGTPATSVSAGGNTALWSGRGLAEVLWAALCSPLFLTGYVSYFFHLSFSISAPRTVICSWIRLCICIGVQAC